MEKLIGITTGIDLQLLKWLLGEKDLFLGFKILSIMSLVNIIIGFISGLYIGNQNHFPWYLTLLSSLFFAWLVWCFQAFIYQTTDNDLAYLNKHGVINQKGLNKSDIFRILFMVLLGVFILQGVKLFLFAGPIEAFCQNLENGKINPKLLNMNKLDIQEMLHRSIIHKLLMVEMIYEKRPWILWIVDISTLTLFCIPTIYKTWSKSLKHSEYELAKQTVEMQLIIDDYEQTMNLQRFLLWKNHNKSPEKYEAFEDAPFNTIRIYPPVQQKLEWDNIENIWKIKSETK